MKKLLAVLLVLSMLMAIVPSAVTEMGNDGIVYLEDSIPAEAEVELDAVEGVPDKQIDIPDGDIDIDLDMGELVQMPMEEANSLPENAKYVYATVIDESADVYCDIALTRKQGRLYAGSLVLILEKLGDDCHRIAFADGDVAREGFALSAKLCVVTDEEAQSMVSAKTGENAAIFYSNDTEYSLLSTIWEPVGTDSGDETQEEPAEEAQEQPAEEAQEEPAEEAQEQPAEEAQEQPAEEAQEQPAEEAQEQPAEEAQEEPAEEAQEEPAEETQEEPAEETQEEPAEEAQEEPAEGVQEYLVESVTEEAEDAASRRRGWQQINGYWFYYDNNGVKVTGWHKLRTSDGEVGWHYFDRQGRELYGWQRLKDAQGTFYFYFDSRGKMVTGWKYLSTKTGSGFHYFDKFGHELYGWQQLKSSRGVDWYYFDTDGKMVTGWHKLRTSDGSVGWHYFDRYGRELYGWQKLKDGQGTFMFYFDNYGKMVTGWKYLSTSKGSGFHYFDRFGHELYGWQQLKSSRGVDWYYFDTDGKMVTGWHKLRTSNGTVGWHYFDRYGRELYGLQRLKDGQGTFWFYFDSYGKMVTGWRKVTTSNGTTGWHYFDRFGHELYGYQRLTDGQGTYWFYFDSYGKMVTGWKQLTTSNKQTGWHYFDGHGHELYGLQQINYNTYYFDGYGKMVTQGRVTVNNDLWQFGSDGVGVKLIPRYRALLIGQTSDASIGTSCQIDLNRMESMLRSIKGPTGGTYEITVRKDRNKARLMSDISTTFSGMRDYDVALFFYSGHGAYKYDNGQYVERYYDGSLSPCPKVSDDWNEYTPIPELAAKLNNLPCKVIVILDSCGSGAAVSPNGSSSKQRAADKKAAAAFNQEVIDAFADVDPGILVDENGIGIAANDVVPNVGDFRRVNKFYVLTAANMHTDSYGDNRNGSFFTLWLTQGIGTSGTMLADANRNGRTTLDELYKYITDAVASNIKNGFPYQSVQVYPANSSYELFCR